MLFYWGSQWNNKDEKIINIIISSVTIKILYIYIYIFFFYVSFQCVKCITNNYNSVEVHNTFNLLLPGVLKLKLETKNCTHSLYIHCMS